MINPETALCWMARINTSDRRYFLNFVFVLINLFAVHDSCLDGIRFFNLCRYIVDFRYICAINADSHLLLFNMYLFFKSHVYP
jgi:hypothetical protein